MSTHTYALAVVSRTTYDEVRKLLEDAGYNHAIEENGVLDMHGIALQTEEPENVEATQAQT
jgi:hypothetical protein